MHSIGQTKMLKNVQSKTDHSGAKGAEWRQDSADLIDTIMNHF